MGRSIALGLLGWSLVGCASPPAVAPTAPSPEIATPGAAATAEAATAAAERPLTSEPAPLPPLSPNRLLPTADGLVVFEVAKMRAFDVRPLARAFVLAIIDFDLQRIEQACGWSPVEAVERLVISGSLPNDRVLAAVDLEGVSASQALECLADIHPESRAQELVGHPVLELGRRGLWATERDGALLLAERESLAEALGGEPIEPIPPMIDGVPVAERSLGDVADALPLVSRDPRRLIAVGHRGGGGGFLRLPTLSITFTHDDEAVAVEGDIDLSAEPGKEDVGRIKRRLRRNIAREMEEVTGDASLAEPLLRAVDEAHLEQRDGHLIFSGRTTALDALERLVNGVARKEIARELEQRRALDQLDESNPSKVEAADVSRGR